MIQIDNINHFYLRSDLEDDFQWYNMLCISDKYDEEVIYAMDKSRIINQWEYESRTEFLQDLKTLNLDVDWSKLGEKS